MEVRDILGLDVGLKRTGIARASNVAKLTEPLMTVPTESAIKTLNQYLSKTKVEAIAVGLPRNLKGEETDQTQWVRDWVNKAKERVKVTFYWQDEALTSVKADELKPPNGKAADTDSLSAALILQDFLDSAESERVVC